MALRLPPLYAILDTAVARAHGWEPVPLARALLAGGARLLQVRAKELGSGPWLDLCEAVVRLAEPHEAMVVVNDRADLARLAGAAGVHVGQDDLPVAEVRRIVGPHALVGLSTHDQAQIAEGARSDASYLAVGPVFGTTTKDTGLKAVGLDLVRHAVARAGRPVVAIGGITLARAAEIVAAGASAAVISDLLATGDPEARVREYVLLLERIDREAGRP